jgi:hypothetical protein
MNSDNQISTIASSGSGTAAASEAKFRTVIDSCWNLHIELCAVIQINMFGSTQRGRSKCDGDRSGLIYSTPWGRAARPAALLAEPSRGCASAEHLLEDVTELGWIDLLASPSATNPPGTRRSPGPPDAAEPVVCGSLLSI